MCRLSLPFWVAVTTFTLLSTARASTSGLSKQITTSATCKTIAVKDCEPASCAATIVSALTACNNTGGGTVYLAAGTFRFADAGAGVHSVFDLQAMNNVRLSGAPLRSDGAPTTTLQVDGRHAFFSLGQCANVSLANLAFALTRVPVTLGTVVDVAANNFTVEVSSDELFPFPVSGGAASAAANDQWMYSIAALSGFDLSTWRMAENGVDLYKPLPLMVQLPAARNAKNMTNEKNTTVTVLGAGKATDTRIQVGGSFILRHTTYSWDGINIQASNGIELENVLMRSVAGMGLFASDTRDIRLSNVQIRRDAGVPQSATADATHFNACNGNIVLDTCYFEGQGDDGINVHGVFHDVREILSSGTPQQPVLKLGSRPAGGVSPLHEGELYEFRNRSTWEVLGSATLVSAQPAASDNTQTAMFDFGTSSPFAIDAFALVMNEARVPDSVHVFNSYFGNNRARGSLFKVSNVLVENSVYDHPMGHCVQAFPDGCYWFESGGFGNWTLRNNTFSGCNAVVVPGDADVFVAACAPDWDAKTGLPLPQGNPVTTGQPFQQINIESCRFEQALPHPAIMLYGVNGLRVVENSISLRVPNANSFAGETGINSNLDGFTISEAGLRMDGWIVDSNASPPAPSNVTLFVNGRNVGTFLADHPRPDLVPKVSPDPDRGFVVTISDPEILHLVLNQNATLEAKAVLSDGSLLPVSHSPMCSDPVWRRACNFPQDCSCSSPVQQIAWIQVSNTLQCVAGGNGVCPDGQPCTVTPLDNATKCNPP